MDGPCDRGCVNWWAPSSANACAGCELADGKQAAMERDKELVARQNIATRFMCIATRRCTEAVEQALLETVREFLQEEGTDGSQTKG